MKKILITALFLLSLSFTTSELAAQVPPPPPGGHGEGGNQPAGGSTPIGGGLGILMALGAAYGGRKVYKAWKDKAEELV
ncbi:MAG: hypothetical protein K8F24_09510 [Bacteroidales bacterium]|nr:hypothetical protein [Bacteroidales bacterium]